MARKGAPRDAGAAWRLQQRVAALQAAVLALPPSDAVPALLRSRLDAILLHINMWVVPNIARLLATLPQVLRILFV